MYIVDAEAAPCFVNSVGWEISRISRMEFIVSYKNVLLSYEYIVYIYIESVLGMPFGYTQSLHQRESLLTRPK